MSTRRRLAQRMNADRADKRLYLITDYVCQFCKRRYAKGTAQQITDEHLAKKHPNERPPQ